jgi:hypothetical protein
MPAEYPGSAPRTIKSGTCPRGRWMLHHTHQMIPAPALFRSRAHQPRHLDAWQCAHSRYQLPCFQGALKGRTGTPT